MDMKKKAPSLATSYSHAAAPAITSSFTSNDVSSAAVNDPSLLHKKKTLGGTGGGRRRGFLAPLKSKDEDDGWVISSSISYSSLV